MPRTDNATRKPRNAIEGESSRHTKKKDASLNGKSVEIGGVQVRKSTTDGFRTNATGAIRSVSTAGLDGLEKAALRFIKKDPSLDTLFKEFVSVQKAANSKDNQQLVLASVQMLTRFVQMQEGEGAIELTKEQALEYKSAFLGALRYVILEQYPEAKEGLDFVDAIAKDPKAFFKNPENAEAVLTFTETTLEDVVVGEDGKAVKPLTDEQREAVEGIMNTIAPWFPNSGKFFKIMGGAGLSVGTIAGIIVGTVVENAEQAAVITGLSILLAFILIGIGIDVAQGKKEKNELTDPALAQTV